MAEAPKPIVFPKAVGEPIPDPPPLPEPGSNIFAYRVQGRMVWVEGVVRTLWTTNVGGTNPGSLPAGLTITGKGAPAATLGADGMVYFDASTGAVYGPKAAGQWPAPDPASTLKGAKGDPGTAGTNGTPGTNGKSVRNGAGAPNPVIGVVGDFYLDTTATSLYGPKTETGWPASGVVLKGSGGSGTPGADGKSLLSGNGGPAQGAGKDGDFWLDIPTSTLWGPKGNGVWPQAGVPLKGAAGAAGVDGKTLRAGAGDPFPATGAVGDFYIDESILMLWGPKKVAGNWDGVDKYPLRASFLLHGTVDPVGVVNPGRDGDFYLNSATSTLFGPRAGGRWPAGVPLKGAPGSPGRNGEDGAQGDSARLLDSVMGLWNSTQAYSSGSMVYWEDLDGSSLWVAVGDALKGSVPAAPNWKLVSRTSRSTSLAAPGNVRIQAIANKTVDVEWDTVAGATSYRVYLYNGTTGETIQRAAMTSTSTSFGLGNLTTATPYKVRVVARTTSGIEAGVASPFVSFTTTGPAAPPAAGRITHLTTTTATLEWDPSPTPGVTSWNVKQVGASGNPQVVAGNFRTLNLTGLTPNTEYTYEVRATKDLGSSDVYGDALVCNFTSAPIATPTNLRITPKSTTSMDVEWDYPTGTQVTGFSYQLDYVGGPGSLITNNNSSLRKISPAELPEGAAVNVQVWARIGDAQSEPVVVSGGPGLPAPTRLKPTTVNGTSGKTRVRWEYPSGTRATGFTIRVVGATVSFDEVQEVGPEDRAGSSLFSTTRAVGYRVTVTPKGTPPGPGATLPFAAADVPLREGE